MEDKTMITGSCCYGRVAFELTDLPTMMATCHCTRCRKVGASNFVFVRREHPRLKKGREFSETYKAKPPHKYDRSFCRQCGTALGEILSEDKSFPIPANALDDDPQVRNRFHEFVAEKPVWYTICDGAKQFEGHPQG